MTLAMAQKLAELHGLAITEHRYLDQRHPHGEMILWMIYHHTREIGHWVPKTKNYRALTLCGGPAKLSEVLATLDAAVRQRRATA
jgi:hypothetical protein